MVPNNDKDTYETIIGMRCKAFLAGAGGLVSSLTGGGGGGGVGGSSLKPETRNPKP